MVCDAAASSWIEPLNLECLLVNTFAGGGELFMVLAFIAIGIIGTKFRMINSTLLIMFALFAIVMSEVYTGFYFLVVLIGGLFAAFSIGRIAKA